MNEQDFPDALAGLGFDEWWRGAMAEHLAADPPRTESPPQPMRVIEVRRDHLLLHDGIRPRRAALSTALADALVEQFDAPAVGDWVLAALRSTDAWTAVGLLPRRSRIVRRVNDGRGGLQRQALVANVDTALLVMGLDHDFNPRRLERYLTLTHAAGIESVVVLSKADLRTPDEVAQRVAQTAAALPPGVAAFPLDTRDPSTRRCFAPWLTRGRTLVALGSSGAGKSSLANTLVGTDERDTGPVRADDSRGRHTTTARTLLRTPEGACLIDTPGLRALRLDIDDEPDLRSAFDDIARWSQACRFRDCRHDSEPGCAVRASVDPARLANWRKLLREARRDAISARERAEQLAEWKRRHRAGMARMRLKRGVAG